MFQIPKNTAGFEKLVSGIKQENYINLSKISWKNI